MVGQTGNLRTANAVCHIDIAGPDIGVLGAFYGAVLGWTVVPRGPGYSQLKTPTLDGGLVEAETASLTLGVATLDLNAALEAAVAAGGEVVMPLTDNGWVKKAQIRDPAGNLMTLIQA
ncbi:MAG: VOC family protein [Brevundimonas sp.]